MKLSEKTIQKLKDKKISIEDLYEKYFYTSQDGINIDNALKLLDENIWSFQEIADKFKSIQDDDKDPSLYKLLYNEKLFQELIKKKLLNKENSKYLLNKIDNRSELANLCNNTPLIKFVLNEFILNKELVDKFNIRIENDKWYKGRNLHTIFDLIEDENRYNKEVLNLSRLNKKFYIFDLNENQKLGLIELIQNNEIALNRLKYIVDSNLESQFDFDSLMMYLKKKEKKNVLNI